jgi:hypothetical protein
MAILSIAVTVAAVVSIQNTFGDMWRIVVTFVILIALPALLYANDLKREPGSIGDFVGHFILYFCIVLPSCATALLSLLWYLPWRRWLGKNEG